MSRAYCLYCRYYREHHGEWSWFEECTKELVEKPTYRDEGQHYPDPEKKNKMNDCKDFEEWQPFWWAWLKRKEAK